MPDGFAHTTLSAVPAVTAGPTLDSLPPPHPDALLLSLCGQYLELDRQWDAIESSVPDGQLSASQKAEQKGLDRVSNNLARVIMAVECKTLDGLRALASIVATASFVVDDDPEGGLHDRMPGLLVRALLGGVQEHVEQGVAA